MQERVSLYYKGQQVQTVKILVTGVDVVPCEFQRRFYGQLSMNEVFI